MYVALEEAGPALRFQSRVHQPTLSEFVSVVGAAALSSDKLTTLYLNEQELYSAVGRVKNG